MLLVMTKSFVMDAVAAPEVRSRVGFSLCEAAERRRREESGAEGSRRRRRRDERRRRERRGAIGAEVGRVWGGGIPLPIRLGGLGERRKLPQRGLGQSPSRNRLFWCILPLKSDLWCQQFP